ncbi:MAG TPA: methyltransferase domain-containing protein [Streptosporangiaceae bacterium]|nr:methyltransferase domain-containing protein [Streptosporangiaceae bacterium]
MTSVGQPAAAWSATFATAPSSAMNVYADVMVPRIFEPWGRELLGELGLAPGEAVLDVACGPGTVTRLAAALSGPAGRVMGCDLSPAMLGIAVGLGPVAGGAAIEYCEAPADRLPVADGSFDVVSCQQGLQFFADRPAALAEMRRALRPGGRIGVAVWKRIGECPPFAVLAGAIGEVAGDRLAGRYAGGPWGLPRAADLRMLLERAGFTDVRVADRVLPVTFEGGPAQLAATYAAAGVAGEIEALSPQDTERLHAAVARLSQPLLAVGEIRSQMASHLVIARR